MPNCAKDDSPVSHEVIDSNSPAPVSAKIVFVNVCILDSKLPSMFLAPSINGDKFVINIERLDAISGNADVVPSRNPPAIPPINWPIAVPII